MELSLSLFLLALTLALAFISIGGGLYEFLVIDPFWPRRPDIIQPHRGGILRRRFWIPAHVSFELLLIATLVVFWSHIEVRTWLLVGLASHILMRVWSFLYFIPRALRFEQAEREETSEGAARAWTRRSRLRFPLDLVTCTAMTAAFVTAVRLA